MNHQLHIQRWLQVTLTSTALMIFVACSASTTSTPAPTVRGTWTRPAFAGVTLPTLSTVAFADSNQRNGYACSSTLKQNGSLTPVATGTGTSTSTPVATATTVTALPTSTATTTTGPDVAPTATINIPGRPTQVPSPTVPTTSTATTQPSINSIMWHTTNGGQSWQAAMLPSNLPLLLCPASALVVTAPDTVYFLAAQGTIDFSNPTSIAPGQLQYQLFQSSDGAMTWKKLTVPTIPNAGTPLVLSPYHLIIQAKGQNLIFATNGSGSTALFTSADGGQTWTAHAASELTGTSTTATIALDQFAGFAAGANGSVLALTTNPTAAATTAPYSIWQSNDGATTWKRISNPTLPIAITAASHAQLFTAPNGSTAYLVTQRTNSTDSGTATPAVGATPYQSVALFQSKDGGMNWGANIWPTNAGKPLGGSTIVTTGANFTVAATGDAYFAPARSDDPSIVTDVSILSAGVYRVTAGTVKQVASPINDANTIIGLAVSQTALIDATATGTAITLTKTPDATATVAATLILPTPTATVGAGTPITATVTTVATTPTPEPTLNNSTDVPILWTNFGPLALLTTKPDATGFFLNVLP